MQSRTVLSASTSEYQQPLLSFSATNDPPANPVPCQSEQIEGNASNASAEEHALQYFASLTNSKRAELELLHARILLLAPGCRIWFSDGRNEEGKVVANPSVGYGQYTIRYKNGTTKEFFRIGISANSAGISVYVMGLEDKTYLKAHYVNSIGKASVTSYCIKFKSLAEVDIDVLLDAINFGFSQDRV